MFLELVGFLFTEHRSLCSYAVLRQAFRLLRRGVHGYFSPAEATAELMRANKAVTYQGGLSQNTKGGMSSTLFDWKKGNSAFKSFERFEKENQNV